MPYRLCIITNLFLLLVAQGLAAETWACTRPVNDGLAYRWMALEQETPDAPVPCHIRYRRAPGDLRIVWRATTSADFCAGKLEQMVRKHREWGWECAQVYRSESVVRALEGAQVPARELVEHARVFFADLDGDEVPEWVVRLAGDCPSIGCFHLVFAQEPRRRYDGSHALRLLADDVQLYPGAQAADGFRDLIGRVNGGANGDTYTRLSFHGGRYRKAEEQQEIRPGTEGDAPELRTRLARYSEAGTLYEREEMKGPAPLRAPWAQARDRYQSLMTPIDSR